MSKLKLLGALLLTIGGTTQLLYAEQPSIMANSEYNKNQRAQEL